MASSSVTMPSSSSSSSPATIPSAAAFLAPLSASSSPLTPIQATSKPTVMSAPNPATLVAPASQIGLLPIRSEPDDVPIEALTSQWGDLAISQDLETMALTFEPSLQGDPAAKVVEEYFLVGTVLALRSYGFKAIEKAMRSAWSPLFTVEMKEVEPNLYLFRFTNRLDLNKVLRCGPWRFNNYLMAFKEEKPNVIPPRTELHYVQIWIQVFGLPFSWQTEEKMRFLGSKIGPVVESDPNVYRQEGAGAQFMRVRVELDMNKRLPRGTSLRMGDNNLPLAFQYERLFNFCFYCGLVDHLLEDCVATLNPSYKPSDCSYGIWLRGIPPRPIFRPSTFAGWSSGTATGAGNPFARNNPGLLPSPVRPRALLPPPGGMYRPHTALQISAPPQMHSPSFTAGVAGTTPAIRPKATRKRAPKKNSGVNQDTLGFEQQTSQPGGQNKKKRSAEKELAQDEAEVQFFEPFAQG